jgi:alpha-beta hydrolase superfamily lysophospholipase
VNHSENTLNTSGGITLFTQSWLPDDAPKAIVIIQHGFCEHSGRYVHVAEHFVTRGYAAYAFDLRGHGRSQGKRIYVDLFESHIEDFTRFVYWVQHKNPNTPVFVLAHSMGSTIAALWAAQNPPDLSGLILGSSALYITAKVPEFLMALSKFLSRYLPHLPTVRFDNPEALSSDPAIGDQRTRDPYVFRGRIPARSVAELLKGAELARKSVEMITHPLLILHGTEDKLTDPKGSQELHDRAGTRDKSLIFYEGLRHEILNEPDQGRVLNDIDQWIEQRLAHKSESGA